ncbi:MAG: hypothetical protein IH851_06650 [Armatimonadetes bacterium]|nr:hypothetical protein [Armatimonadota bacterium]
MRFAAILAVLTSVGVFPSPASAQTEPLGLLVRAGFFWPAAVDARAIGKQWFTIGAEMELGELRLGGSGGYRATYSISLDTYTRAGASSLPVLINYVGYVNEYHYTLGAGVAFVDRPGFDNAAKLTYQVGVGYEISGGPAPLIVELRWWSVSDVSSFLDGFSFTIGVRL